MSELEKFHSPEQEFMTRERRSILCLYAIKAIIYASSDGFHDDLKNDINQVNTSSYWANGEKITEEDIRNIASSSVLRQMVDCFEHQRTLVLHPDVIKGHDVYLMAQQVIDLVDLSMLDTDLDKEVLRQTSQRLNGADIESNPNIEKAVEVWNIRAKVPVVMEKLDDIVQALEDEDQDVLASAPDKYYEENGLQVQEYPLSTLSVPSHIEEAPYYYSLYEVKHGSERLDSLLSDLRSIHMQIIQNT